MGSNIRPDINKGSRAKLVLSGQKPDDFGNLGLVTMPIDPQGSRNHLVSCINQHGTIVCVDDVQFLLDRKKTTKNGGTRCIAADPRQNQVRIFRLKTRRDESISAIRFINIVLAKDRCPQAFQFAQAVLMSRR